MDVPGEWTTPQPPDALKRKLLRPAVDFTATGEVSDL